MNAAGATVTVDPLRLTVRVRSEALRRIDRATRQPLVERVFACRHAVELRLHARMATAEIRLDETASWNEAVHDLACAMRGGCPAARAVPIDCFERAVVTVSRVGDRLTTWRIEPRPCGRLAFRHPRMRSDRLFARVVERLAATMPGVVEAGLESWTAGLVVRTDPQRLDADTLLAVLQRAVDERAGSPPGTSPWHMLGTSTSLAVAATADLAVSALAPVSAVLLVGTNVRTMADAVGDLRRGRLGMATLATAIILGTLATGQFLAAGIMAWSLDFWRRRHRRDIEAERHLLLEDAVPLPACSVVHSVDERTTVLPVADLGPGVEVPLSRWDIVPADGRVATGGAVVDDRCVSGVAGARVTRAGDRLEAGTVVLGGEITLSVDASPAESRLARIGAVLATATASAPGRLAPTQAAEEYAEKFAGPTLATAGLGLLAGDVAMAVAIMRPDYAHAEAMAVSFEDLDAVARGLAAGCLLSSPDALDALADVDTLVLVDHPGLRTFGAQVTRVVTGVASGDEPQAESVRWAASLARHIADPRREALADLALDRGCPLMDVVPESFGDAHGLRLVHRAGNRELRLVEAQSTVQAGWRPLVLEIDGAAAATFEFRTDPQLVATRAVDRIRAADATGRFRVLVAVDSTARRDDGRQDTLSHELHCDGAIDLADQGIVDHVRRLMRSGRKVACVGPTEMVAAARGIAAATIGVGRSVPSDRPSVDIFCLSGDIGSLADMLRAAAERRSRLVLSRRLSIIPNVACVAGAFLLGFSSLVAAVVTNVGTYGTYARASATLQHNRRRHWLRCRPVAHGRLPWSKT